LQEFTSTGKLNAATAGGKILTGPVMSICMAPMKQCIETIRGSGPVSLIIRHAERHPISSMKNPFEAMLTEKGASDAFTMGKQMSELGDVRLYHSPVARCRDTAINIGKGISEKTGVQVPAEMIYDLGGPYMRGDWDYVSRLIDQIGQDSFIRQWFDGILPEHVLMPLEEAALNQMAILAGQLANTGPSAINVTHDWNILILREWAFNLRHEDLGWPDFLDGVLAQRVNSSIHLCYHGKRAEIPLNKLSLPA